MQLSYSNSLGHNKTFDILNIELYSKIINYYYVWCKDILKSWEWGATATAVDTSEPLGKERI